MMENDFSVGTRVFCTGGAEYFPGPLVSLRRGLIFQNLQVITGKILVFQN